MHGDASFLEPATCLVVGQMTQTAILFILGAAVLAAGLTFAIVKFLDRLRKVDIENTAKQITEKAERDASNKLKEADLSIKERDLAQKVAAD